MAGLAMLTAGPLHAADDNKVVSDLQAEVARLKQELANERAGRGSATAPAAAAAPNPAQAAASPPPPEEPQTLDTIVVRSRNRIERLQDVPLSVSVVSGQELDRLGAADVSAITKRAGNVSWNQGNQRTSSLSIRGIGKIGQLEAQDPSVGVIVDGVPYAFNPLTSSYNFSDVEAVEVTRGPQGTLLGKNSSLGVINVTTRRPSFTPSADYSVTIGQRDRVIGKVAAGGPVIDNLLAWRGNLSVEKGAGDVKNVYAYDWDRTYTNIDRVSGKVQFLLTPTPDFNARVSVEATPRGGEYTNTRVFNTSQPNYSNGAFTGYDTNDQRIQRRWFAQNPAYYNYQSDYLNRRVLKVDGGYPLVTGNNGAALELNWNQGNHSLTSITAYRNYHFNAKNDEGTPFAISTTGGVHDDYQQISQELRLTSQPGGFVDYQTGLFLINTDVHYSSFNNWLQDAGAWYATSLGPNNSTANARTNQYFLLDADGNGRQLMSNSLNGVFKRVSNQIENRSRAIFGQANWHLSEPLTLTTGLRLTVENRRNPSNTLLVDNGVAGELNPVAVNGVQLGGFASSATTGNLNAGSNSATQLSLADKVANKYFGTAITGTPGEAYNSLTDAQKLQVAAAKNLRQSQIGTLFAQTEAERFNKLQPNAVISPSYKISEDLTTYVSWQYGEKAGIAQVVNGNSMQARPEKTSAYEWGIKSSWLNRSLTLNADIFLMDIRDYQQSVRTADPSSTASNPTYITYTGNAPKVQAKGLEVDGIFSGIPHTTVRFSGAYNDARYKQFTNSPQPVEGAFSGAPAFRDVTGRTLAGAAKLTWNVGVDYRIPVFGDKVFHADINTAYTSRYNSDVALSDYAWIPANYLTDLGIGLGRQDKTFDVTLLVKNAFNNKTHVSQSWNSYGPAVSRWIGVMFTGKL